MRRASRSPVVSGAICILYSIAWTIQTHRLQRETLRGRCQQWLDDSNRSYSVSDPRSKYTLAEWAQTKWSPLSIVIRPRCECQGYILANGLLY